MEVDILLPTCNRPSALVMTLSGIAGQTFGPFRLLIADQSERPATENPVVRTLLRLIEARGGKVEYHHREILRGIAEQRDFLLRQAEGTYALFIDDDVLMEPWVLETMVRALREQGCAFVGAFGAGLSFLHDVRPEQQKIEYWEGPVQPEVVEPGSPEWERWQIHRAANLYHIGQTLPPGEHRLYKVAWIGACVLYDRRKLEAVGGFSFWKRLPRYHSGEEVLVQNLLMRRWGGCGMMPSGTYFAEAPSSVLNVEGKVDGHALDLLPEMVSGERPRRLAPEGKKRR